MKLLFTMLLLTFAGHLAAQTHFSGIIVDNATSLPIAWAHVVDEKHGKGTVSNMNGFFSMPSSDTVSSLYVRISCIGYKSKLAAMPYASAPLRIELEPDIKVLNEIVVLPIEPIRLIQSAIEKIPDNYPSIATHTTGFYRESLCYDSMNYIYVAEGMIQAYKDSYVETKPKGQVRLMKSRKSEFPDSLRALEKIRFYAGPYAVHRFDIVMQRLEFINKKYLSRYKFFVDGITFLNGNEVYKISFTPASTAGLFQGIIFIDVSTLAFVSAQYELSKTGLKQFRKPIASSSYINRQYLVNYMSVGDKWAIQNIWQQGDLVTERVTDTLTYTTEFVATSIDSATTGYFDYGDRLQYCDFFIEKANNLDPEFWHGDVVLTQNVHLARLHDSIRSSSATDTSSRQVKATGRVVDSKRTTLLKLIFRFSANFGLSTFFPSYKSYSLNLNGNGFSISSAVSTPKNAVPGLSYGYSMCVNRRWSLSLAIDNSVYEPRIENITLGAGYAVRTLVDTRPVTLRAAASLTSCKLTVPIGIVEGPLTVGKAHFSENIDVYIQRQILALQHSLGISIELARQWDLFVKACYLLEIRDNNKILFEETTGIFRKHSSLLTNDKGIVFLVNGRQTETIPMTISPVFLDLGLTYRFRR